MAKSRSVWGIDIGHCALKALRCRMGDDHSVIAESYDYIEYPKILSQPDADPDLLVRDALETFLARNELRGDVVAMSVSGQAGLSRFFKPPPVDAKTLPDIVRYEVKQQIPFPIEDVIWDWQGLGGTEVDDVIVDAEVGLFAIKRDTVFSALQPFLNSDIEVDIVQLAPLATYNVVCFDILDDVPGIGELDLDNPPESIVVLSLGTDATDLIVTNGIKLWLRNIPIGGNHFTKQLSRELKLTHAKAEHLKRNARQAEDPKSVFQAMRPVFNDLVTEIQRSLSFYQGMEKTAKIQKIVLLGNAARLPGLRQYLNKQLELEIAKVTDFRRLRGDAVIRERTFADNVLSFSPSYGLCLQGLHKAHINTNLLPNEFVTERMIRAKKPWVLASVGALMLGMLMAYFLGNQAWWRVDPRFAVNGTSWEEATSEVKTQKAASDRFKNEDDALKLKLERINMISAELADTSDVKFNWPELLSAIYQTVPRDERLTENAIDPEVIKFEDRREAYVDKVESQYFDDLAKWLIVVEKDYYDQKDKGPSLEDMKKAKPGAQGHLEATNSEPDLSGPGWVIEIEAHHFHNSAEQKRASQHGKEFVKKTFLKNLREKTVKLPGPDGQELEFKLSDLGLYYPTILSDDILRPVVIQNLNADAPRPEPDPKGENGDAAAAKQEIPKQFTADRYDFYIQMAWVPKSPAERIAAREERLLEEQASQKGQGESNLARANGQQDEPGKN